MKRALAAIAIGVGVTAAIAAQGPTGPPAGAPVDPSLQFEAASIKPADPAVPGARMMMQPGRMEMTGPAALLLRPALRVQDYQVLGVPDWMRGERYTIVAKAPDGAPPNAMPVMLVNLLKERFKLATHTETREMPIYNLVLVRADGKLGSNLKPTSAECQAQTQARLGGAGGRGGPPPIPQPGEPLPCGMMRVGPGLTSANGQPIGSLVQILAQLTGRPVVDKTGLNGQYDLELKFQPEPLGPPPPGGNPPAIDPDAPNIYTAVQEQLGLKLENARGPVDVVIIDRAERPSLD